VNFDKLKEKKILVTGGAGFIGSNICKTLVDLNADVYCLDNLSTGHKSNIECLINRKNFKFLQGDITDLKTCQFSCQNMDFVLHQAALGSVPRSIKDPLTTNNVNITGFLNMLISSRDNNIKRFIFAASSSTYGDSKSLPKLENIIGKPLSVYATTKYVNELYAENFNKLYDLDTIGLRYFNVFGPNQDPNGPYAAVIPKFINKLIKYESPIINGDGSFSRDFTYVDNVVNMNLLALCSENKNSLNQIYNTACGERTSLVKLVELLKGFLSKWDDKINDVQIKFGPEREGDIPHSLASIEKSKKLLKYNPKYSIELGLKVSIDWYWNNLKNQ
tara:strand:+ start:199 stop:1194 length:996 start_codon:yes stop_codon:yes gene_type:complete